MNSGFVALVAVCVIGLVCLAGTGYSLLREPLVGAQGVPGLQGASGPQGIAGMMGGTGLTGAEGPRGSSGATGASGASGAKGDTGDAGVPGVNGTNGTDGVDGVDGEQGPAGETGLQGEQGLQGDPGETGDAGPQGPPGEDGEDGEDGMDAPVNNPPCISVALNGSYTDEGYYEYYCFNLSADVSDIDGDWLQTTVYYRLDPTCAWDELLMEYNLDMVYTVNKVFKYASPPSSLTLHWMVVAWDGSDISCWSGEYTVLGELIV